MSESTTSKTDAPVIENPEQASSNFYWTYNTDFGVFNFQTTIRGILTLSQIQAHIKSVMEAQAHVVFLGGLAKAGYRSDTPASVLPDTPLPISTEPQYVPDVQETKEMNKVEEFSFMTEKLLVTNSSGKMYYKVVGKPFTKFGVTVWPEVLDTTGMQVNRLEAREYNFPNYKAIYIKNGKGNPEKVIRLEKVA